MSDLPRIHDGTFYLDSVSVQAARTPIGPVRIGEHLIGIRPPRWSDGPAWRSARLAQQDRLESAFGSRDQTWAQASSLTAWVERMRFTRRTARAGLYLPFMVLDGDGRVLGEFNFHLDPASGSAELQLWLEQGLPIPVSQWIAASIMVRIFSLPARVPRVTAPIAADNPGPRRLLSSYGMTAVARFRELREFNDTRVDHDVWWLERTAGHLGELARGMTDPVL